MSRPVAASAAVVSAALLLGACGSATVSTGSGADVVTVESSDASCDVSVSHLASGRHTFRVRNSSSGVTEVYVYAQGDRIMGEVENVGPAIERDLVVDLPAGSYQVACKPGMVGDGIRQTLEVTGEAPAPQSLDQDLSAAVKSYRAYVVTETSALVTTTEAFTRAVQRGDQAAARAAYPTARLHYERIEPIAESFGDLDPLVDMRIEDADATTPFVGFHAIERLIFGHGSLRRAAALARPLNADVARLAGLVRTVEVTPLMMANGAKSLLDEVAKSKVTGEEERFSRIDLVDFSGNIDGAKYAYAALRPAIVRKDKELAAELDARFASLIALLNTHRSRPGGPGFLEGSPFVTYDALSHDEVRALAAEVDGIAEPLGLVSGVIATA